jgi:hypothetical protein
MSGVEVATGELVKDKIGGGTAPLSAEVTGCALRCLAALGHVEVANQRCGARYKDGPRVPGPQNPPVWCDLTAGHDGPHRHASGHHWVTMDRLDLIEVKPIPALCAKCGVRWPCADAEKVFNALI